MNIYRFISCSRAVSMFVVLAVVQLVSATGVQAQVRHTIIAASGEAAPAGGTYGTFLNTISLNARGEVAFDVRLGGPSTSGVFVSHGGTTSAIALGGNPDPAAGNFAFVSAPSLTTSGDVIFNGTTGIFRGNGTTNVPLLLDGDPAPGGGSFAAGGTAFNANSRGLIAFHTFINGGVATEGVFRNDGFNTTAIALDGTPAPTGGSFLFFSSPVIDEIGRVAFYAGTIGGPEFGIYRGDGQNTRTLFAANQTAPGGRVLVDFSDPITNKPGDVLVLGQFDDGSGLFLHDGQNAFAIAQSGDATPKGGIYTSFFGPLTLNDRGQTAFEARFTGAMSGVFRGDRTTVTPIAVRGTAAAGTTGTFDTFGALQIGKDGSVVFIATLTIGVGGVDPSNNTGIWIGTSESDLHLVARTGQSVAGKTLTRPLSLAHLNMDQHSIVWLGRFAGNATAIVSSDLASNLNN